jgi:GxxExxY protein
MEIIFKEECYAIVGACFEVYNQMGHGFVEPVYQECLQIEFAERGIPHRPKIPLDLVYKGHSLEQKYVPDFICFEKIIVELKAVSDLADEHRAQVHNYLKATGYRLGLLVNFGQHPKRQYERIVRYCLSSNSVFQTTNSTNHTNQTARDAPIVGVVS